MFTWLAVAASTARGAELGFAADKIEAITGLKGSANGAVFKLMAPRTDVPISVDGWKMPPFMGLTSWAAFTKGKDADSMVMGDFVLFQDEVSSVMRAALTHGLEVTALHNHFFYDEPHVYFMHIGGEGDAVTLAGGVRAMLDAEKEVRAASPQPQKSFGFESLPAENHITAAAVEKILGVKVQANNGMAKAVIGRSATMECGCAVGADMGVNTWAAFAGADDNAVVDGDFAVTEEELQPALKSLTGSGINVVAIHSHMTGEKPRILFLHYWGRGKAADLAASLKKALSAQASVAAIQSVDQTPHASNAKVVSKVEPSATKTTNTDIAIAVRATAEKDCGCGACAAKGCKPCRGKNCYYCVAKGLVTTECGCGTCSPSGCDMCGPGCDVCKFNLKPVAGETTP